MAQPQPRVFPVLGSAECESAQQRFENLPNRLATASDSGPPERSDDNAVNPEPHRQPMEVALPRTDIIESSTGPSQATIVIQSTDQLPPRDFSRLEERFQHRKRDKFTPSGPTLEFQGSENGQPSTSDAPVRVTMSDAPETFNMALIEINRALAESLYRSKLIVASAFTSFARDRLLDLNTLALHSSHLIAGGVRSGPWLKKEVEDIQADVRDEAERSARFGELIEDARREYGAYRKLCLACGHEAQLKNLFPWSKKAEGKEEELEAELLKWILSEPSRARGVGL
ncbi:hypothetical protein PMZ80_007286 [Knufia obscura]|uniref:Uncharacterized protein n=2 Tax=Knufia TaxID=430999 RepID=A0AAN8EE09_9EURO|nr:hypothetical protein PMZ80_007286 [Knufia obscura]KAK5953298.1 hypothetical protein OHC33_005866 [Knufia fluminis]